MTKPLFVYVNWSENPAFEEKSIMSFDSFEMKCSVATHNRTDRLGYDKTSIKVLFSDGAEYNCRLDLDQDCRGFKDHANSMLDYHAKREQAGVPYHNSECIDFLKTIKF
jgi:hypothetical protein